MANDHSHYPATNRESDPAGIVCERCGAPMTCEFCDMGDEDIGGEPGTPATHWHVDYATCDLHLSNAVDNVSSRMW